MKSPFLDDLRFSLSEKPDAEDTFSSSRFDTPFAELALKRSHASPSMIFSAEPEVAAISEGTTRFEVEEDLEPVAVDEEPAKTVFLEENADETEEPSYDGNDFDNSDNSDHSDNFDNAEISPPFEQVMPKQPKTSPEEVRDRTGIMVVDEKSAPLIDGEYAFHQGTLIERGTFGARKNGRAYLGKIDPARPFVFEVRDRVCAIRAGAFLDPDDRGIEYGGTWFDWTLVRDDKKADVNFWPYYWREMDFAAQAESYETTQGRSMDRFLQHEHVTRRPIQIAKQFLARLNNVKIRATASRLRVGPFVRYTDHERAVIWLETVTPNMVRVRYKPTAGGTESSCYASTVRVGGRHFAAVEIGDLEENKFYDYMIELAPMPASGPIPAAPSEFIDAFPKLSAVTADSMKEQFAQASINGTGSLTFRTLRKNYGTHLHFATGSCRWYPGDKKNGKDAGPDMLEGLGNWLSLNAKDKWPHFLFFGGDQIYADEIGDDHGEMLIKGRFASRVPGPEDPAASVRDKLIDGAWAGRFAHRYKAYKDPGISKRIINALAKLDDIHRRYPDINGIYREYPDKDSTEKLKARYAILKGKRGSATLEAADEKQAREAISLLPTVNALEKSSEPFRAFLPYWETGSSIAFRRNPMRGRYLSHNFLLWKIPEFETQLPTVANQSGMPVVRKPDIRGHPAAADGMHASDFAEYAYLYERAWTSSRSVRVLLAQIPTFLMFDDHEVTDDWNFDISWVRMIHNRKDDFRMWPKTLTDGLAAYWVYQGWGNKAPSQWGRKDPRVAALVEARKRGADALPALRECIHRLCFAAVPSAATHQTGTKLDWHYKLPFNPPFLVPDCRSRKYLVAADDPRKVIDHDDLTKAPMSQTIDNEQLGWMREILSGWDAGPAVFIAPSTPLLLQKAVMDIMQRPERAARGITDLAAIGALVSGSSKLVSNALLRIFRRDNDLEHMIRDRSWRDLWGLIEAMRKKGSPVKSLVLVSGDVHHSYSMTANLPGSGRPRPELVQITSSGLRSTVRKSLRTWLGEGLSAGVFEVGKYRLVPGFVSRNDTGAPDLVLYQNTVALVDVSMSTEANIVVTYLSDLHGNERHVYRYTSGAAYMDRGEPAVLVRYREKRAGRGLRELQEEPEAQSAESFPLESPFSSSALFLGQFLD